MKITARRRAEVVQVELAEGLSWRGEARWIVPDYGGERMICQSEFERHFEIIKEAPCKLCDAKACPDPTHPGYAR